LAAETAGSEAHKKAARTLAGVQREAKEAELDFQQGEADARRERAAFNRITEIEDMQNNLNGIREQAAFFEDSVKYQNNKLTKIAEIRALLDPTKNTDDKAMAKILDGFEENVMSTLNILNEELSSVNEEVNNVEFSKFQMEARHLSEDEAAIAEDRQRKLDTKLSYISEQETLNEYIDEVMAALAADSKTPADLTGPEKTEFEAAKNKLTTLATQITTFDAKMADFDAETALKATQKAEEETKRANEAAAAAAAAELALREREYNSRNLARSQNTKLKEQAVDELDLISQKMESIEKAKEFVTVQKFFVQLDA
jgi:hypothetical protein